MLATSLAPFFSWQLGGNTLLAWAIAVLVWLAVSALVALVLRLGARYAARLGGVSGLDELLSRTIGRTSMLFALSVGLLAALQALVLPERVDELVRTAVVVVVLIQLGMWGSAALRHFVDRAAGSRMAKDPVAGQATGVLRVVGRLVVWSLVGLLILANLGIDITAVIAGLGIGGVAVALAVQNILSDLFASLSIVIDQPFEVGDFILVGDHLGTVEHIGIKTTRIRSLSGEQVIFGNADLLSSRIHNLKRMEQRRAVFHLHVAYDTPADKLAAISDRLRQIIEAREGARFDRAHMHAFTDEGIRYEVVWFSLDPDYAVYMDLQESINLAIAQWFREEGIRFAFPVRTVQLSSSLPELTTAG